MRYEVTWMYLEPNFEDDLWEQTFEEAQFDKFEDAIKKYNKEKSRGGNEHVKISVILDEFSH